MSRWVGGTMDNVIVCVVQQKMRLPADLADFEAELRRFLRVAQAKGAQLIVFPELAGMMAAPPLLNGLRAGLLKQADRGRQSRVNFWERARSKMAAGTAGLLGSDFQRELARLLDQNSQTLWDSYAELFGRLAQEMSATIVAGSLYTVDSVDGGIRNVATVFGPQGAVLGQQSRVVMAGENAALAEAGDGWGAISTPVGRIGLLLGPDVLYPETGRILAYQGAEMLISLGACTEPALYHRLRAGLLARVQENQLYGAISFTVGYNPFTPGETEPFVGRSAICAPLEFTNRYTGIMAEVGAETTEGILTAAWDFAALRQLWEVSAVPVRRTIPLAVAAPILTSIYQRGVGQLPSPTDDVAPLSLPAPTEPAEDSSPPPTPEPPTAVDSPPATPDRPVSLDDLPVMASSEAPLEPLAGEATEAAPESSPEEPVKPRRWPWQR